MKGEKNRIKLSVGIASTACTRCVPKTTYDIPKKHKEWSASRMQMWELEYGYPLLNGNELRASPTDSPRKVNIPIVAIDEAIDIIEIDLDTLW